MSSSDKNYIYIDRFWRSNELSLLKNLKEEEVHLHHRVSLAESSLGGFPSIPAVTVMHVNLTRLHQELVLWARLVSK